jgi:NTE family protein
MDLEKVENLVFSSGGVKGISHIGALEKLKENNYLNNIINVLGSSIGSIIALLFVLDYTPENMYKLVIDTEINKLIECDIDNNLSSYGVDNGIKIEITLKNILKESINSENITFKELYNKTNKNLIISSLCLNDGKVKFFCYENTPDLEIYRAIKMSLLVPFLFIIEEYNGDVYIDSGLVNGYPINFFGKNNKKTLGLRICNKLEKKKIKNVNDYFNSLVNSTLINLCEQKVLDYESNTINIIINEYQLLDINLSKYDKNKLFLIGYISVEKFISNNQKELDNDILSNNKSTQTD